MSSIRYLGIYKKQYKCYRETVKKECYTEVPCHDFVALSVMLTVVSMKESYSQAQGSEVLPGYIWPLHNWSGKTSIKLYKWASHMSHTGGKVAWYVLFAQAWSSQLVKNWILQFNCLLEGYMKCYALYKQGHTYSIRGATTTPENVTYLRSLTDLLLACSITVC